MGAAALFVLAILGAAALAASSSNESAERAPGELGARDRIAPDLSLCRESAATVSLLDSSALVRWVNCPTRTAIEVAQVTARLEEAAQQYRDGGYTQTAQTVRTTWNQRLDAEDARARETDPNPATGAPRTSSDTAAPTYAPGTTSAERRDIERAPAARRVGIRAEWNVALGILASPNVTPQQIENAKTLADQAARDGFNALASGLRRRAQQAEQRLRTRDAEARDRLGLSDASGRGALPPRQTASSSSSALERELVRAEEAYPGARREYELAMREASPTELRRAADQIENTDRSYPTIVRQLRARAAQREAA